MISRKNMIVVIMLLSLTVIGPILIVAMLNDSEMKVAIMGILVSVADVLVSLYMIAWIVFWMIKYSLDDDAKQTQDKNDSIEEN